MKTLKRYPKEGEHFHGINGIDDKLYKDENCPYCLEGQTFSNFENYFDNVSLHIRLLELWPKLHCLPTFELEVDKNDQHLYVRSLGPIFITKRIDDDGNNWYDINDYNDLKNKKVLNYISPYYYGK